MLEPLAVDALVIYVPVGVALAALSCLWLWLRR